MDEQQTIVIVGLPAADDPIREVSSENPPHITLIYMSADFAQQADQIIAGEAAQWQPVPVGTRERTTLGDDEADVVMVDPGALGDLRTVLEGYEPIRQGMDAVEQFPDWTPHATLGYPQTPALPGELTVTIMIDRLAILGDDGAVTSEYALGEAMDDETPAEAPPTDPVMPDAETLNTVEVYGYDEVPLYGVLAPEGIPTGDGRLFLPDSLTWTEPPMTLRWQEFDDEGHKGSVATGRFDRIWREPAGEGVNLIKFEGTASMSEHADRMVGLLAEKVLGGISVDLDDAVTEFRNRDGSQIELAEEEEPILEIDPGTGEEVEIVDEVPVQDMVTAVAKGRIRSGAACAIPAFPEAFIAIGTWADHETPAPQVEAEAPPEPTAEAMVASAATILSFAPGTQDGPGWLTHPVDTDRLRDYWVRGEGAAKIGWGIDGDFNRCRTLLAPYVKPQHLAGYCANRHKDALGIWPGEHTGRVVVASAEKVAPMYHLVASAAGDEYALPPEAWFEDPHLGGPSPIVVLAPDENGLMRTYGHVADFTTCHTAYAECTLAPHSSSGYAYFRKGVVLTAEGTSVATGVLTVGTGHAGERANARRAAAHYDNTGNAVADVAVGEDAYGIWFAGYIRPWATQQQVHELRAATISGDWRMLNGDLDMIAALAVNTGGFPIPRIGLAASAAPGTPLADQRVSLVAAGVVPNYQPPTLPPIEEIVAAAVKAHRDVAAVRDAVIARRREQFAAIKSEIGAR